MNYTALNPDFTKQFYDLVSQAHNIVITAHVSPDDDSIASVLSMYEILSQKFPNTKARIIYTGVVGTRYKIFKNYGKIEFVDDVANHVASADMLIVLDGSQLYRFSTMPEKLSQVGKIICIDHHASPIDNFTLSLIIPEASSTAELIYKTLVEDGMLSKELAEIFLLGLLSDTGNFSYIKSDQTDTFLTGKKLVEVAGTSIDEFKSRYNAISARVFALIQELIKNMAYVRLPDWPPGQYSFLTRSTIEAGNYTDEEIKSASHIYMAQYVRTIEDYTWGFVLTPRTGGSFSLSGRSLPLSVNVRDMFERMGVGGGHDRAAGAKLELADEKACLDKITDWMKNNKPLLN